MPKAPKRKRKPKAARRRRAYYETRLYERPPEPVRSTVHDTNCPTLRYGTCDCGAQMNR